MMGKNELLSQKQIIDILSKYDIINSFDNVEDINAWVSKLSELQTTNLLSLNIDPNAIKFDHRLLINLDLLNTTDYLKTEFENKKDFDSFVKLIRGRSNFKTNDKVEFGDKILTLSTCAGNGEKRLVVHAVLIKE